MIFVVVAFLFMQMHVVVAQIPEGEIAITASSTLPPSRTAGFSPENLMDGTEASWSEGADGNGVGAYFDFDFRYPDNMRYVAIKNGYGVEKYWEANARIRTLKVTDMHGSSRILHLEDTPGLRVYGLTTLVENSDGILLRGEPLSGNHFRFKIMDVYDGSRWDDACITEVMVNQWVSDYFVMEREYVYQQLFREYFDGVVDGEGALYIESDWDGYVPLDVSKGYYYNEIISGDGTGGYNEYRVFVDEGEPAYYFFSAQLITMPDESTMEGRNRKEPVFISRFSAAFELYDLEKHVFVPMEFSEISHLFDTDPLKALSDRCGKELTVEEVRISYSDQEAIGFIYPLEGAVESAVTYRWTGSLFVR